MTRLALLAAAVALAACGPAPSPLSGADWRAAYAQAFEADDATAAQALLEGAAASGGLHALQDLAQAYERGRHSSPRFRGEGALHLPVRAWPWSAWRARARFERALADSVAAGDHRALTLAAERLILGIDVPRDTAAARALYDRLVADGADLRRLAALADGLGDEAASIRHLAAAAAGGDPEACVLHHWATDAEARGHGAAALSASIDHVEACRPQDPAFVAEAGARSLYGDGIVERLRAERALGNAAAAATLDSLTVLGVFDRHPRLAALVAEAG